jgi:hypothetical protein
MMWKQVVLCSYQGGSLRMAGGVLPNFHITRFLKSGSFQAGKTGVAIGLSNGFGCFILPYASQL